MTKYRFAVTLLLLTFTVPIAAQLPAYELTPVTQLSGYFSGGYRPFLNNLGQVAGTRESAIQDPFGRPFYRGFVWESGQGLTELETFGGGNSYARGINDSGVLAGSADSLFGTSGAIWRNGTIASLPLYANDINNNGHIAGYIQNIGSQAAVYDGRTVQRLGTLGGAQSYATAINERGQVVGDSGTGAFVWSAATGLIDLSPPETPLNYASDINDLGQAVGTSFYRGALLWENGQELILESSANGGAYAINNREQITGYTVNAQGQARATLWQGGQQYDLNSIFGADSEWLLYFATDINENGQIVCMAARTGTFNSLYAVLLTPASVPEPQFVGLLFSLLFVSGGVRFTTKRQGRK